MTDEAKALTDEELRLIADADIIKTKVAASSKIRSLLERTRLDIRDHLDMRGKALPEEVLKIHGKISIGENYRQFPYQVLDFPRFFGKQDVFAFRSMFLWGNFFSHTLHLGGAFIKHGLEKQLNSHLRKNHEGVFFCINKGPWEYHYGQDNYLPLSALAPKDVERQLTERHFIKLSARTALTEWQAVPGNAVQFLEMFLEMTGW